MTVQQYTINIATPPDDLPHKSRKDEILELKEYITAADSFPEGTDRILVDGNMKDANRSRIYVERNELDAITGIYAYSSGAWKRWEITTDDISADALGPMLSVDSDKLKVNLGSDSLTLGDADETTGKKDIIIADNAITPARLAPAVAGKGLIQSTDTDEGYLDRIDVNPDDSTVELYDSTPDVSVSADKVWKLRIKDGGVTSDKIGALDYVFAVAPSTNIITTTTAAAYQVLQYSDVTSRGITIDSGVVTPDNPGFYQFNLALWWKIASGSYFNAGHSGLQVYLSGQSIGAWYTNAALPDLSSGSPAGSILYHRTTLSGLVHIAEGGSVNINFGVSDALGAGSIYLSDDGAGTQSTMSFHFVGT